MRLWHEALIPKLSRQHLLGQHRECCALRGMGWGKRHSVVNYVFDYNPYKLYLYHLKIISEMQARGYKPDMLWLNPLYRGKKCEPHLKLTACDFGPSTVYPEHNNRYYKECIDNLAEKGYFI